MVKKQAKKEKSVKNASKHYGLLVLVFCVAVSAALVLPWIIVREVYLAETKSVRENAENIVINDIGASKALVDTILAEDSGCVKHLDRKAVYYIIQANDRFALTQYGCTLDAKMFYKKVDGKWKSLSPTNQFIHGQPLCSHLKEHSIPASFAMYCYGDSSMESESQPVTPSRDGLPAIYKNPVK